VRLIGNNSIIVQSRCAGLYIIPMTEEELQYIAKLSQEYPHSFVRSEEFRGDITIIIRKGELFSIMKSLKEWKETVFDYLVDITAVDFLALVGAERFEVVYHLYSHLHSRRLRVKVLVPEDDPAVPTMVPLWQSAIWMERETAEMFGIVFVGHPDLRKLLLPDDFPGHPLRKDYPLEGEGYRSNFPNVKGSRERKSSFLT